MSSGRFEFSQTELLGVTAVRRKPMGDERGFFCRFYCRDEFREAGLLKPIAQINHSLTRRKGSVRGMHFQYPPHAETKVVSCVRGEILDVAVDVRESSPTFLKWHAEVLSESNRKSLIVGEGFAHGFQSLADECEVIYLVTVPYTPEAEGRLHVRDPRVGINWPLEITDISGLDQSQPFIDERFRGVRL